MPNGRVRQYNIDMKAKADRDVQYIIEWILRDEPRDDSASDDGYEEDHYWMMTMMSNNTTMFRTTVMCWVLAMRRVIWARHLRTCRQEARMKHSRGAWPVSTLQLMSRAWLSRS